MKIVTRVRRTLVTSIVVVAGTLGLVAVATPAANAAGGPSLPVMNSNEALPDGVWFRNSSQTPLSLSHVIGGALLRRSAAHTDAFTPTPGTWTAVGLTNQDIRAVAIDPNNANVLYAGTATNGIFKSTDGGATWTAINNGIPNGGRAIVTIVIDRNNSNIVYAGGAEPTLSTTWLFKTIDGGAYWSAASNGINPVDFSGLPPAVVDDLAIDPTNTSTLYAAMDVHCGSLYKSTEGATTWTRVTTDDTQCDPLTVTIDPLNHNTVYIVGGDQRLHKSTDAGATWTTVSTSFSFGSGGALAIDSFNSTNLYGWGDNGAGQGVYKSTDGGASWTLSTAPGYIFKALAGDPTRQGAFYAGVGISGGAADVTYDAGASWSSISNGLPSGSRIYRFTIPAAGGILYAATSQGIYGYDISHRQITALNPATVWISKNLLNIGMKLDLKVEVYRDTTFVSSGEIDGVSVGTGGNPTSATIPFNAFAPVDFPAGSQLKVQVYARNACSGSLLGFGTANLYYNSSSHDSRFGATIGTTPTTYHLLDGFLLGTAADTTDKSVSVAAGAKCSPFKSFGTWTITP